MPLEVERKVDAPAQERAERAAADNFRDEIYSSPQRTAETTKINSIDKTASDNVRDSSSISPKDLEDCTKLSKILTEAAESHDKWEKDNGKETPWQEYYAKYINDRLRAGGHAEMDEGDLARLFRETGEAHHQFEIKTGEPDKDWAGWYANYFIQAAK